MSKGKEHLIEAEKHLESAFQELSTEDPVQAGITEAARALVLLVLKAVK